MGVYVLSTFFYSYAYFTITEAVSPILIVFYVFFLVKGYREKNEPSKIIYYIVASFFIGFDILVRPFSGLAALLLPSWVVFDFWSRHKNLPALIKPLLLSGLLPFLMIGAWGMRNYEATGEFVVLEKAFHPESLDRMKPEFAAFWNLAKTWGEDGADFNQYQIPLYNAAIQGDTTYKHVEKALQAFPLEVVDYLGAKRLSAVLVEYQQVIYTQKPYYDSLKPMPSEYTPRQLALADTLNALALSYKNAHLLQYRVYAPLRYLKDLVVHSNTSHIAFFQVNRGRFAIDMFRNILALLHISLYAMLFIHCIALKKDLLSWISFCVAPMLLLLFLVFYYQAIEQRYMLPLLPLILLSNARLGLNKVHTKY